jgi:hypothetical protein
MSVSVAHTRRGRLLTALTVTLVVGAGRTAVAQTAVTLPDTTRATTLTAAVPEQARVTVPVGIAFAVTNVSSSTTEGNVAVSAQNIVLATATKQLRISLQANAASFTPPTVGATTWTAGDVSWNGGPGGGPNAWVNATGSAGTLSSAIYTPVATCNADAASCSCSKITFTLAAKPTIKRSGAHTLTVTWKFESIGA